MISPQDNYGTLLCTMPLSPEFVKYLNYNFINHNEYPECQEALDHCTVELKILLRLPQNEWKVAPTSGSSEACHMALLEFIASIHPNDVVDLYVDIHGHTVWDKLAKAHKIKIVRYKDDSQLQTMLGAIEVSNSRPFIVSTMGATVTGSDHDLFEQRVVIPSDAHWHLDCAVSGFLPVSLGDNRYALRMADSINVSGHKFGNVPIGLGWYFRKGKNASVFDESVKYLNGSFLNTTLGFSRPAAHIMEQSRLFNLFDYEDANYQIIGIGNTVVTQLRDAGFDYVTFAYGIITFQYGSSLDMERKSIELLEGHGISIPVCNPTPNAPNRYKIVVRQDLDLSVEKVNEIITLIKK